MSKMIVKKEVEEILIALGGEGSSAFRSALERKLGAALRRLGPARIVWDAGRPTVLVALGGESMFGARRVVGYARRVG